jgi:hypothetical protein
VGELEAEGTLALATLGRFQKYSMSRQLLRSPAPTAHRQQQHLILAVMGQNENSKRAASVLIIAQHKFKQALKKEDTEARSPPISVELSAQFLSDLDAVLKQNTPVNVQVSDYKANDHLSIGAD